MTYEEALEVLKTMLLTMMNRQGRRNGKTIMVQYQAALMNAIEAVEKQIPKKPKEKYMYSVCVDWRCPVCKRFHRDDFSPNFCPSCGQTLDWSDEK